MTTDDGTRRKQFAWQWLILAAVIGFALLSWLWNADRYVIVPAPNDINKTTTSAWRIDRRTGALWLCQHSCTESGTCNQPMCMPVMGKPN
jgi:hypothetical protein